AGLRGRGGAGGRARPGRSAAPVWLGGPAVTGAGAAGGECVIGIDVGGTMLKGGVCDRGAAIVHGERRRTARDDAEALVDGIVALAGDLAAEGRRRFGADGVAGIGLAVPGLVHETRGVALRAVNLPWRDLALAA